MKRFFILLLFSPLGLHAQQEARSIQYNKKYLDLKIASLEKYAMKVDRQQQRLLRRLERKEKKLLDKIQRKDSVQHAVLMRESVDFDCLFRSC